MQLFIKRKSAKNPSKAQWEHIHVLWNAPTPKQQPDSIVCMMCVSVRHV